ncbi:hypothetical protein ACIPJS_37365 [Streptomyces sp. NPDC086783]|uniref:hypothetical protein n=1 Tax=Streptomyces sp. NPDC086783 TaxID=3365758 RepID=UPI0037F8E527
MTYDVELKTPEVATNTSAGGHYLWLLTFHFDSVRFPKLHDCGVFQSGNCDHTAQAYGKVSIYDVNAYTADYDLDDYYHDAQLKYDVRFKNKNVHDNTTYTRQDLQDQSAASTQGYWSESLSQVRISSYMADEDSASFDDVLCGTTNRHAPIYNLKAIYEAPNGLSYNYNTADNGDGSCEFRSHLTAVPVTFN